MDADEKEDHRCYRQDIADCYVSLSSKVKNLGRQRPILMLTFVFPGLCIRIAVDFNVSIPNFGAEVSDFVLWHDSKLEGY